MKKRKKGDLAIKYFQARSKIEDTKNSDECEGWICQVDLCSTIGDIDYGSFSSAVESSAGFLDTMINRNLNSGYD